jgi:preprotein translocase subunit SecB
MSTFIGIDVTTKDAKALLRRLKSLKTTLAVCDGGMYHADRNYSQVWLHTTWSEDKTEEWVYNCRLDYQGVFELNELQREALG